jgi:hypothetical protein
VTKEESIVVQALYAMRQLGEIKRYESIVEKERQKVEERLLEHMDSIGDIRRELVRLVANEGADIRRIDEMCDIIRKLNGILDYEKNVRAGRNG